MIEEIATQLEEHGFRAERNVGQSEWMRSLVAYSRRGHTAMPYVTLDAQVQTWHSQREMKYPLSIAVTCSFSSAHG